MNLLQRHPEIGMALDGKDIVFSKEELSNGKWCFSNTDLEIIINAKKQVETLKFYKDWVAIID